MCRLIVFEFFLNIIILLKLIICICFFILYIKRVFFIKLLLVILWELIWFIVMLIELSIFFFLNGLIIKFIGCILKFLRL